MRTSFMVGIFGLAVAVAVTAEWASRRTAGKQVDGFKEASGPVTNSTDAKPVDKTSESPSSDLYDVPRDDPDKPADGERVIVLGGDGGFRLNAITLSERMFDEIDQILKGPDAVDILCGRFVIEGHTDNLGSKDVNDKIALARAIAVRQYLSEQFEIPRDAVKLVSYGADRPLGDNSTQEGRTKNRRVVIRMTHDVH